MTRQMLEQRMQAFFDRFGHIRTALSPYRELAAFDGLDRLAESLERRGAGLLEEGRVFHLAVFGQVKAGKSTFLNELLFDGEELLPLAATPKTAVLTQMEYGEQNELLVEYYNVREWRMLTSMARSLSENDMVHAARELTESAVRTGLPLEELLAQGYERLTFSSRAGLMGALSVYVGEDSPRSCVTKCVTLRTPCEALRGLVVVDTPGLNDPVASRTERARSFMERCDAAFFLSRATHFLDESDLELLAGQLPRKGLRRLILTASQFDRALMDTIGEYPSLRRAVEGTRGALRAYAAARVDEAVRSLRDAHCPPPILEVVRQCREPLFISTTRFDAPRDERERLVVGRLGRHGDWDPSVMEEACAPSLARGLFAELKDQKNALLAQRMQNFLPAWRSELAQELSSLRASLLERSGGLREQAAALRTRAAAESERVNETRARCHTAFGQESAALETRAAAAEEAVRKAAKRAADLDEREGLRIQLDYRTVYGGQLLRPRTWLSTRRIYESVAVPYTYVTAEEASGRLASLLAFAEEAGALALAADTARLQNALYPVCLDYLSREECADAAAFLSDLGERMLSLPASRVDFAPQELPDFLRDVGETVSEPRQRKLREETRAFFDAVADELAMQLHRAAGREQERLSWVEERFCEALFSAAAGRISRCARECAELQREERLCSEAVELTRQYE